MNKAIGSLCAALFALSLLNGCGSKPVAVKSAKSEIESASARMDTAKMLAAKGLYEQAKTEYESAMEEISKGEKFASGTELTQLGNMKKEVRQKRTEVETKAMTKATAPKKTTEVAVAKVEDPEIARKKLEAAKAAELAAASKDLLSSPAKSVAKTKIDETEETEAVNKDKEKEKGKNPDEAAAANDANAKPAPKKDKNGIYNNPTKDSPPLEVVRLERYGKFNVAYCQLHNTKDDGLRITVATFFKNNDNQDVIAPLTTAAFPYDNFSTKVKDLIADQSLNNIAPNKVEIGGHEYLQFVCVGESNTEDLAKLVAKVYVNVLYSDGSTVEATGIAKAGGPPDLVKGLVKKQK